jgi:hypothetical protein
MKRLLRLVTLLTLILTLTVGATRTLGATILPDPDPFLVHLQRDLHLSDGVWCWRGLCPGRTTHAEVVAELTDGVILINPNEINALVTNWRPTRESTSLVNFDYSKQRVLSSLSFTTETPGNTYLPGLTLATLTLSYGTPLRVGVIPDQASVVHICYAQGLCARTEIDGKVRLNPHTQVDILNIAAPEWFGWNLLGAVWLYDWHGFAHYYEENIW